MAEENLGTAVLKIVVNDDEARSALNLLKRDVQATTQQATKARRTTGRAGTDPDEAARKKAERAADQAANKRVSIQNRLNLLEAKGVDVTAFRLRAARANEAAEKSQFDTARRINAQLGRALSIEENRLRVSAAQTAQLKRQEAATKTVATTEKRRAEKPTGVGFATTPEQILASRGGTQKGAATGINALESTVDKAARLRNRLNILDAKGVDTVRLRATYEQAAESAREGQLATSQRLLQNLSRQVSGAENDLRVTKLREAAEKRRLKEAAQASTAAASTTPKPQGPFSPVGGLKTIPDSPAGIRERKRLEAAKAREARAAERAAIAEERRASQGLRQAEKDARLRQKDLRGRVGGAISSGIIGGGFPLLFGQGVGAAAGGLAGGVAGGALGGGFGFGLSVVGTALGAAFDEALNKAKTLATGLQDPIGQFDALKQASLLSGKGVEKQAQSLIAAGREAEAAALIQRDLATSYGDISDLTTLSSSFDQLARIFAQLSVTTAQFVSGPLTEFLDRLAGSLTITPARQKEIESQATSAVAAGTGPLGIKGSGFFGAVEIKFNGKTYKGSATGIRQAIITDLVREDLKGIRGRATAASAAPTDVEIESDQKRSALLKAQFGLIAAQVQGYKSLTLERQSEVSLAQEALDIDNLRARKAGQPEIERRREAGRLERQALLEQEKNNERDLLAQRGLEAAQDNIKLQSINRQIVATQALGKAERGVARDTLATTQNIQAGIDAAKDREREIGAQIDAARLRGGDANEQEASRLVGQQQVAAQETRLELERGALALTEAGEKLRDDLRNAVLDFTRVRSDPQGLNRFLNPQQRQQRAEFDFQTLLPQFRQAQGRFTQLTGAPAPEFRGPTAGVNEAIRNFITSVQAEDQVTRNLVDTQAALNANLEAYSTVVSDLAAVTRDLSNKNWAVNVAVSGGQAAVYGDVVNGAISP